MLGISPRAIAKCPELRKILWVEQPGRQQQELNEILQTRDRQIDVTRALVLDADVRTRSGAHRCKVCRRELQSLLARRQDKDKDRKKRPSFLGSDDRKGHYGTPDAALGLSAPASHPIRGVLEAMATAAV